MKTQLQHFYSSHRKLADTNEAMDWLSKQDNAPTQAELEVLRAKRPSLWNKYKGGK